MKYKITKKTLKNGTYTFLVYRKNDLFPHVLYLLMWFPVPLFLLFSKSFRDSYFWTKVNEFPTYEEAFQLVKNIKAARERKEGKKIAELEDYKHFKF